LKLEELSSSYFEQIIARALKWMLHAAPYKIYLCLPLKVSNMLQLSKDLFD
jgi:hypothetical protein